MSDIRTAGIAFALTYHSEWQDGYGAQGWKLDLARNDPAVVACTAYTGEKTPTSVLVHDILDHLVSGFPLSGYANEARATAMHGLRNGIEVRSSYEWMADELLNGDGRDELARFLPPDLLVGVPGGTGSDAAIAALIAAHGRDRLKSRIVERFFGIGLSGIPVAFANWQKQRLEFERMHGIGLCLQALLVKAQDFIGRSAIEAATGRCQIGNMACEFIVATADPDRQERIVQRVE
jgi:hypothetical protein